MYSWLLSIDHSRNILKCFWKNFVERFGGSFHYKTLKRCRFIKLHKLIPNISNITLRTHIGMSNVLFLIMNSFSHLTEIIRNRLVLPSLLKWIIWINYWAWTFDTCLLDNFLFLDRSLNSLSFGNFVLINVSQDISLENISFWTSTLNLVWQDHVCS